MSATPLTDDCLERLLAQNADVSQKLAATIAYARQLQHELTTWRTLPPREHYNLSDCHKALQWHLKQLNIEHEHIGQILDRMAELHKALPDVGGA